MREIEAVGLAAVYSRVLACTRVYSRANASVDRQQYPARYQPAPIISAHNANWSTLSVSQTDKNIIKHE